MKNKPWVVFALALSVLALSILAPVSCLTLKWISPVATTTETDADELLREALNEATRIKDEAASDDIQVAVQRIFRQYREKLKADRTEAIKWLHQELVGRSPDEILATWAPKSDDA